MNIRKFGSAAAAVAVLCLASATARGDTPHGQLIETKAAAVVQLKFVLAVQINFQGQNIDREFNREATGVLVDPAGLVMAPAGLFNAPRFGMQVDAKATPTNLRVIFPGDEKEYPAILGAKDSKLGLGFVLIKDLEGKEITVVDLTQTVEPKIGDTLYGVTRLGQGFDHAPMCDEVRVVGRVTKPRTMWAVQGAGNFIAEPLYNAEGAVAGIAVQQEGVGEGAMMRPFLLPLKVAQPTVRRAKKEAERALEEALEREKEEAEAAAEEAANAKEGEGEGEKKEGEGEGEKKEGDDGGEKKDGDGGKKDGDGE